MNFLKNNNRTLIYKKKTIYKINQTQKNKITNYKKLKTNNKFNYRLINPSYNNKNNSNYKLMNKYKS